MSEKTTHMPVLFEHFPLYRGMQDDFVSVLRNAFDQYWLGVYMDRNASPDPEAYDLNVHRHPIQMFWQGLDNPKLIGYFDDARYQRAYDLLDRNPEGSVETYRRDLGMACKPGKFFRKLMPQLPDHEIGELVSKWQARFDTLKQLKFEVRKDIARVYLESNTSLAFGKSTLQGSCMRYAGRINQVVEKFYELCLGLEALVLTDAEGKIVCRALIWRGEDLAVTPSLPIDLDPALPTVFVDRVYYSSESTREYFFSGMTKAITESFGPVNLLRKANQSFDHGKLYDVSKDEALDLAYALEYTVPQGFEDLSVAPFLDTMAGWDESRGLLVSVNHSRFDNLPCLQSTSGAFPHHGYYSDYHGEFIPQDDAVEVDGDWYYRDDVVLDRNDEYILAWDATYCQFYDAYVENDQVVRLYGTTDYADRGDINLFESGGQWFHPEVNWDELLMDIEGDYYSPTLLDHEIFEITIGPSEGQYTQFGDTAILSLPSGQEFRYLLTEEDDAREEFKGIEERFYEELNRQLYLCLQPTA